MVMAVMEGMVMAAAMVAPRKGQISDDGDPAKAERESNGRDGNGGGDGGKKVMVAMEGTDRQCWQWPEVSGGRQ